MADERTHADLVAQAAKWANGSLGCNTVLVDTFMLGGEYPDVIAWKWGRFSVVIEVKRTRSDFRRDRKKWHRRAPERAMGQERWYFAPPGVIPEDEVPTGFGLAVAHGQRVFKRVKPTPFEQWNQRAELEYLCAALRRITRDKLDADSIVDTEEEPKQES